MLDKMSFLEAEFVIINSVQQFLNDWLSPLSRKTGNMTPILVFKEVNEVKHIRRH